MLVGLPVLTHQNNQAADVTEAPIEVTTTVAPRTFAPFDRAEYVQLPVAATATAVVEPTSITVAAKKTGMIMPTGLTGLSIDSDQLNNMHFDAGQSTLGQVLALDSDPVIRFGAQSVDRRFFWTSTDEPIPDWTLNPAYKGDVRPIAKITPANLENLNQILTESNAKVLLAVDLGHFDPARAADFAKWAYQILGDKLLGVSLGNEPNGYNRDIGAYYLLRPTSYSFADYAKEATAYSEAIATAAPTVKIMGPQVYEESWWGPFLDLKLPNVGAMTFHHYPMSDCGSPAEAPTGISIANVLSRTLSDSSAKYAAAAYAAVKGFNVPAWNSETNWTGCSGSNQLTQTQASAQWTVNYAMRSATEGVTKLFFHGALDACKGGPPNSPLCDSGAFKKPNGIIAMRAQYYSMMMVNKVGAGDFLQNKVTGNENIYPYPVQHADGTLSVMIVNQNDSATIAPAQITLTLPAQTATGTMTQLAAPELTSQDRTRIDGLESSGVATADQLRIPGYAAGAQTITVAINSGTSTILNFAP
ncbi:hypothetical protein [Arthrobacter sp. AQ5-05]|uniref:hypothetical protein n=1 Tax=Arthrobacter sp. AQ5-05 TaxID=2184581 RepID=UPI0018A7D3E7|nr:hypothetical protein [Arthrobacter sp. AQ5-05]